MKVVIEIDGEYHEDEAQKKKYDKERQAVLEEMGYRVIRFTNSDVLNNWDIGQIQVLEFLDNSKIKT